ncbi:response regulator transcription factor [Cellvibrio japonicus]|nr:response regulator transcription factor [Cellvibrio japonicus]QEI11965.1 response regulator transcription factor [Cellvibrio japonicus]QEI15539.1 response regulator transcription factor [Cellvibrio japonicus]QEI19118.1 response regulator transcription factor [Cellvibrio japonicus]
MQQIFIAPAYLTSPRWYQAFPEAVHLEQVPPQLPADALVWVFVNEENNSLVARLSAQGCKVIGLTAAEQVEQARRVMEAGASGYLHYLAVPELLVQVASVVEAGGLWLGADLMRQLIRATARQLSASPLVDLSSLTCRERLVAEAVAAGKTNKEVARELEITERTVKAHMGAIFEKLQVRDRLQLVLLLSGKKPN